VLCDQHPPPTAGDGALVPFLRIYRFDCDTGALIAVIDRDLDGQPYVVQGTVEACDAGSAQSFTAVQRVLCDTGADPQMCFLRTEIYAGPTLFGSIDTEADGVTPYAPIGPIRFDCDVAQDLTVTQLRRQNLIGPFTWNLPGNAVSVTVKCRAVGSFSPPSVTVTDAAATVSPLFVGDEETWTARCGTLLAGTFTVVGVDPGDLVTVLWTEEV
jgi:hypothetical protein